MTVETQAPDGSFKIVDDISNEYVSGLGNERTRRQVHVYPVLPEDFSVDRYDPGPLRDGIAMIIEDLDHIKAIGPQPGERFHVVSLRDDPMYGYGFFARFVLSSQERAIILSSRTLIKGREEITPPSIKELMKGIKIAMRLQPKLKTPG